MEIDPILSVSVIIPARNAAATIERAVRSLAPDHDLIREILLVDDGSHDNTDGVALAAARYHRLPLTVLATNVENAGAARNIGLHHARGQSVFFLDADDELAPGGLRCLSDALCNDRCAHLAVGSSVRRAKGRTDKLKRPHGYVNDRSANVRNFLTNRLWPIAMGSALLSRVAAEGIRFPDDLAIDEDTCFWAAILATTDVVTTESVVLYYNLDEAKMARRYTTAPRREFLRIAAAYRKLAADGLDRQTLNWRKSWIALRMARQLIKEQKYSQAWRFMRIVSAHPDFRSRFRVRRYSAHVRAGLLAARFRQARVAGHGAPHE